MTWTFPATENGKNIIITAPTVYLTYLGRYLWRAKVVRRLEQKSTFAVWLVLTDQQGRAMSSYSKVSAQTEGTGDWQNIRPAQITEDHFISSNGNTFAGYHLLVDLWQAHSLDDLALMRATLQECVSVSNATLLHIHLHHFEPNGGISGVALLAESHISVHTWPERAFAAFDLFMCGKAMPHHALAVLQRAFSPQDVNIRQMCRGVLGAEAGPKLA